MPEVIAVGRPLDGAEGSAGLLAPGTDVLTTTPGATYAFKSGSSMATAYVSGVAALVIEREPLGLHENVGDTVKSFAVRAHKKGLELAWLIDPDVPFVLDRANLRSKSKNTPFDGARLQGRVMFGHRRIDGLLYLCGSGSSGGW